MSITRKWAFFWLVAFFSTNACAQLQLGDFSLGAPKSVVMQRLHEKFSLVTPASESRYQMPVELVSATQPASDYRLGDFRIVKIKTFFNEADLLSQVEIVLDTVKLEEVKKLIPHVERSQLEPIFKDTWEIFLKEGEITYFTSRLSDTTQITMADKPTSINNIEARRRSNLRFKSLNEKIDGMIDTLKNQQTETAR